MGKALWIVLGLALAGLSACADYEGRKTNCWSFVETAGDAGCTNWVDISG